MSPKVQYALLDWDNTLRKGFTIISWTKYLCDKKAIREETYGKLLRQFELYKAKEISYEQLATSTTEVYAQALVGVDLNSIENLAHNFYLEDTDVFSYTNKLFDLFKEKKIDSIIISGSPKIVLSQYAKHFGFSEIYGMDIEVLDGRYTGVVNQDYGAEKFQIVKQICHNRNNTPLISFGDSGVDDPLLKVAKYGYFIDRKEEMIKLNGLEIAPLSSMDVVIKNMSSLY